MRRGRLDSGREMQRLRLRYALSRCIHGNVLDLGRTARQRAGFVVNHGIDEVESLQALATGQQYAFVQQAAAGCGVDHGKGQ